VRIAGVACDAEVMESIAVTFEDANSASAALIVIPTHKTQGVFMRLLALPGSLRIDSTNAILLRAAAREAPAACICTVFEELADIPLFSPDRVATPVVTALREAIAAADGVMIACPEYAHSIPGAFKNALDWIVGSDEMTNKPVMLLAASLPPRGLLVREALLEVLGAMSARVFDCGLSVPLMGKQPDACAVIVSAADMRARLRDSLERFVAAIREA
jgi:NAD(P)H-dependent FMN reductase